VEEVNLRGIHTGGTRGDDNVSLGDLTNLGGSGDDERFDSGLQLEDGVVVENVSDLALQVRDQRVELGLGGTELSVPVVLGIRG